jgi:hypothetical protein
MTLSESPSSLKPLRLNQWKFQRTFHTPLNDLKTFVTTIVSAGDWLKAGSLTIDEVVFEPKHLISLLRSYSITPRYTHGVSFTAANEQEVEALLSAALGDWIDFVFVPNPKPFVIYADHDEYTTFYAQTKSNLNRVTEELKGRGFEMIRDYQRHF